MLGIASGLFNAPDPPVIESNPDALSLTGHRSFVNTNSTFQNIFRNSYTLSIWFQLNSYVSPQSGSNTVHTLFGTRDGADDEVVLSLNSTGGGKIQFHMEGASDNSVTTNTDSADNFADGEWRHIAVTVANDSETSVIIYVNGAAVDTTNTTDLGQSNHNNYTNASRLFIGANSNGGAPEDYFYGAIKDPAIWSEALTAANIAKVYNNGVPFDLTSNAGDYENEDTLVAYYRFIENGGTVAEDDGSGDSNGLIVDATRIDSGL